MRSHHYGRLNLSVYFQNFLKRVRRDVESFISSSNDISKDISLIEEATGMSCHSVCKYSSKLAPFIQENVRSSCFEVKCRYVLVCEIRKPAFGLNSNLSKV